MIILLSLLKTIRRSSGAGFRSPGLTPISGNGAPGKVQALTRLSNWLYKVSTSWLALISLAIFLAFAVLVLPGQSKSAAIPDLSFYYSAADLYEMALSFGEAGRREYVVGRFTFDLIWPVVYTLFLTTSISWIFWRAFRPGHRLWRLNIVPIFGAAFDYLENIAAALVLSRYPLETPGADFLASWFTMAKWILISGSFVLLLVGAAAAMWPRVTNRAG